MHTDNKINLQTIEDIVVDVLSAELNKRISQHRLYDKNFYSHEEDVCLGRRLIDLSKYENLNSDDAIKGFDDLAVEVINNLVNFTFSNKKYCYKKLQASLTDISQDDINCILSQKPRYKSIPPELMDKIRREIDIKNNPDWKKILDIPDAGPEFYVNNTILFLFDEEAIKFRIDVVPQGCMVNQLSKTSITNSLKNFKMNGSNLYEFRDEKNLDETTIRKKIHDSFLVVDLIGISEFYVNFDQIFAYEITH